MTQIEYVVAVANKAERLSAAAEIYARVLQNSALLTDSVWLTGAWQRRKEMAAMEFSKALQAMAE